MMKCRELLSIPDAIKYPESAVAIYTLDQPRVYLRAGREATLPERALGTRFDFGNESRHGRSADVARVFLARTFPAGRRSNDTESRS